MAKLAETKATYQAQVESLRRQLQQTIRQKDMAEIEAHVWERRCRERENTNNTIPTQTTQMVQMQVLSVSDDESSKVR